MRARGVCVVCVRARCVCARVRGIISTITISMLSRDCDIITTDASIQRGSRLGRCALPRWQLVKEGRQNRTGVNHTRP